MEVNGIALSSDRSTVSRPLVSVGEHASVGIAGSSEEDASTAGVERNDVDVSGMAAEMTAGVDCGMGDEVDMNVDS